jgi:hypothetical protein
MKVTFGALKLIKAMLGRVALSSQPNTVLLPSQGGSAGAV